MNNYQGSKGYFSLFFTALLFTIITGSGAGIYAAPSYIILEIAVMVLWGVTVESLKNDKIFCTITSILYITAASLSLYEVFDALRFSSDSLMIPIFAVIALTLAVLFAVSRPIEGTARLMSIIAFFAVLTVIILAIGSIENGDRMTEYTKLGGLFPFTKHIIKLTAVITAFLTADKQANFRANISILGIFFIGLSALYRFSGAYLLGDYAYKSKYAFLSICSSAGTHLIHRFDGVYPFLLTLSAFAFLYVCIFSAQTQLSSLGVKMKIAGASVCIACPLVALVFLI